MMIYTPICKQQGLIIGTGTVVVACGWKPVEAIARYLDPSQYAALGSLYSPAGVEYLIRNILANPQVTGVVALKLTKQDENSGSVDALRDFLAGRWSIEGIASEDIERVRALPFALLLETSTIADTLDYLSQQPPLGGESKICLPEQIESKLLPGTMWGHRIEGKTIADTWIKILHRIRTTGRPSESGYGERQELIDLMAVVTEEPEELHVPNWLPVDQEYLENYFPQLLEDAPVGVKYTYGSRLRSHFGVDQIEQCISKLVAEPEAASAVMTLWDVKDHTRGGSPCLNHVWLKVVEGALSLTAVFRSNDMFDAWPANAFGLRKLQIHIRDRIHEESDAFLKLAPLITLSESAHIYEHSYAYADKIVAEKYEKGQKTYDDPVGNYEIRVEGGMVAVFRMLPWGNVCAEYRGTRLNQLCEKIFQDAPAMCPSHAMYLGKELQRAWDCLKNRAEYFQG